MPWPKFLLAQAQVVVITQNQPGVRVSETNRTRGVAKK
jgi:hypothetical protein